MSRLYSRAYPGLVGGRLRGRRSVEEPTGNRSNNQAIWEVRDRLASRFAGLPRRSGNMEMHEMPDHSDTKM